jgi:hypothetical protein
MQSAKFNVVDAKYTSLRQDTANTTIPVKLGYVQPATADSEQVPAAAKRASKVSKAALNHLVSCNRRVTPDYAIFISRYGELPFIEKNNEDNVCQSELSPTSFSHSVHNTLSCLYSIVVGSKAPSTSLSLSEGIIKAGTWEAISFLSSHEGARQCLVTIYDSHLPERYDGIQQQHPNDFILSFVIEKEARGNLSASGIVAAFEQATNYWQELQILDVLCEQSQNNYRDIQRIYDNEKVVNTEYLTEYYV